MDLQQQGRTPLRTLGATAVTVVFACAVFALATAVAALAEGPKPGHSFRAWVVVLSFAALALILYATAKLAIRLWRKPRGHLPSN